ncbi:MAG: acetylxylan esterase [Kiritimatiellae bacterium]|nr:acetylxylan esterase [Kiritimatiellia bacterium]
MQIRDYLSRVATEITDNSLAGIDSLDGWQRARPELLRRFLDMQGILHFPPEGERSPLNTAITGVVERDDVTIHKLHFQSLPGLYVTGNLYVPNGLNTPAPAVLYVCGHASGQKVHYQAHPRRWAQLGFVTLIIETIEFGELPGDHHGASARGQFQWHSRGYTPAGVEVWNAIRAVDLLQARQDVLGDKIGITGISGGGFITWQAAAADTRIAAAAPVCGTFTVKSQVGERYWDDNCYCAFWPNAYRQDQSLCGALIAPRPLLVASAEADKCFSIASVRETMGKIERIYGLHGAADTCRLVVTPGEHAYSPRSIAEIFAFLLKHLKGKEPPLEALQQLAGEAEPKETLRVYVNGPPADERTTTIHDTFVPKAAAPLVETAQDVARLRVELVENLRRMTFGHFPENPCEPDWEVLREYEAPGEGRYTRIAFSSEPEIRLYAELFRLAPAEGDGVPVLIHLDSPAGGRREFSTFIKGFDESWLRLGVSCRGVGEAAWGQHHDMQRHIRRCAVITGRTVASMQVYDALRAIELARNMPMIRAARIMIAGQGQTAVVALYAALLAEDVDAVILSNPPPTLDMPGNPDGTGDAIELLNALRFTDLAYTAGLLFPMNLVFVGERPAMYRWTEELYRRLGREAVHVERLEQYKPEQADSRAAAPV